jgi:hypothetical protein
MISLEFEPNKDKIERAEIYIDNQGIKDLERAINFLKSGKTDHIDLFSKTWGGDELTGISFNKKNIPIQYLKITFVEKID